MATGAGKSAHNRYTASNRHGADHSSPCSPDNDDSGWPAADAIDGSPNDGSEWRSTGADRTADWPREEYAIAGSPLNAVRSADFAATDDGARAQDNSSVVDDDDHDHNDHRSSDDDGRASRIDQRIDRTRGDRRLLRGVPGQGLQCIARDLPRGIGPRSEED